MTEVIQTMDVLRISKATKSPGDTGIVLLGCTSTPLSAYLKALGVLRLVSEQADATARGRWTDEVFSLSGGLSETELIAFFLNSYQPTPILAPWNGGSGFWGKKASGQALAAIDSSTSPRLSEYRSAISAARGTIDSMKLTAKPDKKQKQDLMRMFRATVPDSAVQWLDAAFMLGEDKPKYPALLGTGANDGNMDFTANFMQNLASVLDLNPNLDNQVRSGKAKKSSAYDRTPSEGYLRDALFGSSTTPLKGSASGQFNPGAVGGPNATRGFGGTTLMNPWDFILMMKGTVVFAGSVVWRLNIASRGMASFPFSVDPSTAGWGSASDASLEARAETWVPLWSRSASYREVSRLFAEGRAQISRRRAQSGTDFARAVAGLGVDRGITDFVRYGFLQRSGKAYLSVPLGKLKVAEHPDANLINDLDPWLDSLRRLVSNDKAPASYRRCLRRVEDAIFDYCSSGRPRDLVRILAAVGHGERTLALGGKTRRGVQPLQSLRDGWVYACRDVPEFRLALSLASINDPKIGPLRLYLEPVKLEGGRWKWTSGSGSATPHGTHLLKALADILSRRIMEGSRFNLEHLPIGGDVKVTPIEVDLFLSGQVDDGKLLDLVWVLTAIRAGKRALPSMISSHKQPGITLASVPRAYALLKMLMLPKESVAQVAPHREHSTTFRIPPEPAIMSKLGADDVQGALALAVRRLRSSGLFPISSGRPGDMRVPDFTLGSSERKRLAAALLFPISDVLSLSRLVIRPSSH